MSPAAHLGDHIAKACDRVAPTWPLDQFIAVNPYWGWRSSSALDAGGALGALRGTALTMPRSWYREQWVAGRFTQAQLRAAAVEVGNVPLVEQALDLLGSAEPSEAIGSRMALVTDVRDLTDEPRPGQTWTDAVIHEISQHCASYFDEWQASWHQSDGGGLFSQWRLQESAIHGVVWRKGRTWARQQLASLPAQPQDAIAHMLREMNIPEVGCDAYLTGLLISVNGWAAWCSYVRWQARLAGSDDNEIVELLAVRLAWDWLLQADTDSIKAPIGWGEWAQSWMAFDGLSASIATNQRLDWLLQSAVERSYQDSIISELSESIPNVTEEPSVQAVFCIDVRSEVFRRAFESVRPDAHTRGFAGFFGLAISYTPIASSMTRPQLPGLLAPVLNVTETTSGSNTDALVADRDRVLGGKQRWDAFRSMPSSVFSFVESMGLLYGPKLVKDSVPNAKSPAKWEHEGVALASLEDVRPHLGLVHDDPAASADVAQRVLKSMGLVDGFAPLVLLCGHGGQSANNPQAAGLDCGACGGQTGEVNARVLADLLNSNSVRTQLMALGIEIPESTWFLAGLHNTTTDEVRLFDTDLAPVEKRSSIDELEDWLAQAGSLARAERAPSLGLESLNHEPESIKRILRERANDWSQVRPEWGLTGNAAFIVGPRSRTRHMNLAGRSFLHDYDWRSDTDFATLTNIMTAPMVVTNWINMQYYASTVDNRRYGSGNKVLHNVVGGRIGVFEGNGGDLRIGLAMQSLHDGHELRHIPLRLSVFIEAPRDGIEMVIAEHEVVRDLIANDWILLFRIDSMTGGVEHWTSSGWLTRETSASSQ